MTNFSLLLLVCTIGNDCEEQELCFFSRGQMILVMVELLTYHKKSLEFSNESE